MARRPSDGQVFVLGIEGGGGQPPVFLSTLDLTLVTTVLIGDTNVGLDGLAFAVAP